MSALTWLGHAAFLIEHDGKRVAIDPYITGNPKASLQVGEVPRLDGILLTHGHSDHLGDAIPLSKRDGAVIVAASELAKFCRESGAPSTHAMAIGGGHTFPFGHVRLVTAIHGGSTEGDTTGRFSSHPCGMVVTMGKRVYHCGDTALTMDMQLLEGRVDVMLVPIGDNYTMGPEDAARAVGFVKPKTVVPMHYGTFPVLTGDPQQFVRAVGTTAKVVVLEPGGTLEL